VERMVSGAQLQISKRLARERDLVSSWWRIAFFAVAALALLLGAVLGLVLRRPRRWRDGTALRRPRS
jgi:hypothetical protein